MNTNKQRRFWQEFGKIAGRAKELLLQNQANGAFELTDHLLISQGIGFCFDLTMVEDKPFLIFSPEGDFRVAQEIDALINDGPHPEGWGVLGRRQAKGIEDVCAIVSHLYFVDLECCKYSITKGKENLARIFVPSETDLTPDECLGFANTLLWHLFGEAQVMSSNLKSEVIFGFPRSAQLLSLNEFHAELQRFL